MPSTLSPGLADRFVVRRGDGRSALVRADFGDAFDALGLLCAADVQSGALVEAWRDQGARLLGEATGRGPVALLRAPGFGWVVVRRYRRGGAARRISRDRYLAGRRAERELRVTEQLRLRGVPVAEPLAAVRSELRPGYRAALVTRWAPGTRPASEALRGATAARAAETMRSLGRTAARLHSAGGWHADLHADNFLVRSDFAGPAEAAPLPILIDLDRGRALPFPVPAAAGRWSLRRLARHLRKRGLTSALGAMDALRTAYALERRRLEDEGPEA